MNCFIQFGRVILRDVLCYYLHDGAGSQDPLLHVGLAEGAADGGKVAHGVLRRHGLASPGLSTHNDGLVSLVSVKQSHKLNSAKTNSPWPQKKTKTKYKTLYLKCQKK